MPDKDIDRLRWQCRRGLLELDCIFADYLETHYLSAGEQEKAQFRALLNEQDPDLQAWLLFGLETPGQFSEIVEKLRAG